MTVRESWVSRVREMLESRQAQDIDGTIAGLAAYLDTDTIEAAEMWLKRQKGESRMEMRAWQDFEYFDLVIELSHQPDQEATLRHMHAMLRRAIHRYEQMLPVLRTLRESAPDDDSPEYLVYQAVTEDFTAAVGRALVHIPDAIVADANDVLRRLQAMFATPDERRETAEEARLSILGDDNESSEASRQARELREAETEYFGEILAGVSPKDPDRMRFFYDKTALSLTPEEMAALDRKMKVIIARAQTFMDNADPSPENVQTLEKMVEHVPEFLRPPTFLEAQIAWRKTSRLLQEEAIAKRMQADDDLEGQISILRHALSSLLTMAGHFNDLAGNLDPTERAEKYPEIDEAYNWTGQIANFTDVAEISFRDKKTMEKLETFLGLCNNLSGIAVTAIAGYAELAQVFAGMVEAAALVGSSGQTFCVAWSEHADELQSFAQEVSSHSGEASDLSSGWNDFNVNILGPALGLAQAVIKFGLAIQQLRTNLRFMDDTQEMLDTAHMERLTAGDDAVLDGGAFEGALVNEIHRRRENAEKAGVDAGVAVLDAAANAASLAGQAWASVGIRIVGKTITVGGRIYFANVDFAAAQAAKATLRRAQAGDPLARIEIFEKSSLYAKLYIATLVKEENRLAITFLIQRGIAERDLHNEANTAYVLRDYMMDHAGQVDELETTDSRLAAMLGEDHVSFAQKVGKALTPSKKRYDPDWTYRGSDVVLHHDNWASTKSAAEDAGLFRETTGVVAALRTYVNMDGPGKVERLAHEGLGETATIELYNALGEIVALLTAYGPRTNPQPDAPSTSMAAMAQYKNAVRALATTAHGAVFDKLVTFGKIQLTDDGDIQWSKAQVSSNNIDVEVWRANWNSVKDAALFTFDASAQETAIGAAKRAWEAYDDAIVDDRIATQDDRKLAVKARDAHVALTEALKAFQAKCSAVRAYTDYLSEIIREVLVRQRAVDKALNSPDFSLESGLLNPVLDADKWREAFTKTKNRGLCPDDDCKIRRSLVDVATKQAVSVPTDPKKRRERQREIDKACMRGVDTCELFLRGEVHPSLAAQVDRIRTALETLLVTAVSAEREMEFRIQRGAPLPELHQELKDNYEFAVSIGAVSESDGNPSSFRRKLKQFGAAYAIVGRTEEEVELRTKRISARDEGYAAATAGAELRGKLGRNRHFAAYLGDVLETISVRVGEINDALASRERPWTVVYDADDFDAWSEYKRLVISGGFLSKGEATLGMGKAVKAVRKARTKYLEAADHPDHTTDTLTRSGTVTAFDKLGKAAVKVETISATLMQSTLNTDLIAFFKGYGDTARTLKAPLTV